MHFIHVCISSEEHQAELMFPLHLECLAYFLLPVRGSGSAHNGSVWPSRLTHFLLLLSISLSHTHTVTQIGVTFVVLYLWNSLKEHKLAVTWKRALACKCVSFCVCVCECRCLPGCVWECLCEPLASSWQSCCWAHSLATAAADGWESHFSLVPRTTFWVPELHNVFSHLHPLCWYQTTWCSAGTCVGLSFFFLLFFFYLHLSVCLSFCVALPLSPWLSSLISDSTVWEACWCKATSYGDLLFTSVAPLLRWEIELSCLSYDYHDEHLYCFSCV